MFVHSLRQLANHFRHCHQLDRIGPDSSPRWTDLASVTSLSVVGSNSSWGKCQRVSKSDSLVARACETQRANTSILTFCRMRKGFLVYLNVYVAVRPISKVLRIARWNLWDLIPTRMD